MDKLAPLSDIMTSETIRLHVHDTLKDVNAVFEKYPFHHIPIVDQDNRVVGMISKIDLLQLSSIKESMDAESYEAIRVDDFMTSDILTLRADDSVGLAADIFMNNIFHAVPVVEEDKLVGIVTTQDVIKYAFERILPVVY